MKYNVNKRSLKELIKAECLDYFRREEELKNADLPRRVRMEYAYLDSKIEDAVRSVVGDKLCLAFIFEIGEGIGYAKSDVYCYSERIYKEKKRECVIRIAEKLYLAPPSLRD